MEKILLIFLFITVQSIFNEKNDNFPISLLDNTSIKIGLSKTYFIKYFETTNIFFPKEDDNNDSLQVNIHSINCNIKLNSPGQIINDINLNIYSIIIENVFKLISLMISP